MAKAVPVTDSAEKLADFDVIATASVTAVSYSKSLRRTR
jgi:hypothetical protein